MIVRQLDSHITWFAFLSAKRIRIRWTIYKAAEAVGYKFVLIAHEIGWLTVVLELCVIGAASWTIRLKRKPAVFYITICLVDTFGRFCPACAARVRHIRAKRIVVLHAADDLSASYQFFCILA
jgi:hypothetical protein